MQLTPLIAVHLTAALAAVALGPVALWARKGRTQRPRLHRAAGHAWVTLMLVTALSAIFIRDFRLPNWNGYTGIHVLIPVVLGSLFISFRHLFRANVRGHQRWMQRLYFSACVIAGAFTLIPGRLLGDLVWSQWLGGLPCAACSTPASLSTSLLALSMPLQLLTRTPGWVFALFAVLLGLGAQQLRTRTPHRNRVASVALGMTALSLWGVVGAFAAAAWALPVWAVMFSLACSVVVARPVPVGATYDPHTRRFTVPGSAVPLLLIMGILCTKYVVGVWLHLRPEIVLNTAFSSTVCAIYGMFSGVFLARAWRLWHLVRSSHPKPAQTMPLAHGA